MPGHGANPTFFLKKKKDWKSRTLAAPYPLRPITSHFCLNPHPLESGRHMCITVNSAHRNHYLKCVAEHEQNKMMRVEMKSR